MPGYGLADAMYDINKGMEQGQDRKFQIEQREKDAEFKAESQARQRQDWGLQDSDRAYQDERRKVTDQRADEQWARTQELWKDDDAKRAYENSLMTAKKALQVFETSGGQNWGGIIKWYNDTNNYDNGLDIQDVKRGDDGSFTATFNNGQTKVYKDINDVREQMAMAMHPDAWIKLRMQKKYGGSGSVPAQIQTVEWIAENITGGNKDKAWQLAQMSKTNPQELAAKLYLAEKNNWAKLKKDDALGELVVPSDDEIRKQVMDAVHALQSDERFNPMAKPEPKKGADGLGAGSSSEAQKGGAPYQEGTRLRGKDGRVYEVRNGKPVPVE